MAIETLSNTSGSLVTSRLGDSRFAKPVPANNFRGTTNLGAIANRAFVEDLSHSGTVSAVTTKPMGPASSFGITQTRASDPEQLALDLVMFDPLVQSAVHEFGKLIGPAANPWPQALAERYGADRLEQLRQYQALHDRVRTDFARALNEALHAPSADEYSVFDYSGLAGWQHKPTDTTANAWQAEANAAELPVWQFDPQSFADWYRAQPGLSHQAFATLYPGRVHSVARSIDSDDSRARASTVVLFGNDRWRIDLTNGYLSPADDLFSVTETRTDLIDATQVRFDPELGLVTRSSNLRQDRDWFDDAFDAATSIAIAYIAVQTGGAAASAAGWSTSSATGAVAAGAVTGAVGAALTGATQGQFDWQSVVRGLLSGAISGGIANISLDGSGTTLANLGLPASTSGSVDGGLRAVSLFGQSSLQGVMTAALSGQFQDGARQAALQFVAGELGRGIELHIRESALTHADAQTLRSMGQLAASAIRVAGNEGNPMQAFASNWLQGLLPSVDGTLASAPAPASLPSSAPEPASGSGPADDATVNSTASTPVAPPTTPWGLEPAIGYSERQLVDDEGSLTGQIQITQTYGNGLRDVTLSDAQGNVQSFARIPADYTQAEIDEIVEVYAREWRGELGSQTDPGFLQTADRLNGPRSANDPAMRVFTVERLIRLASEEIRGAGDPKLAEAMFVLEPRRVGADGNVSFDKDPDALQVALATIATVTGISIESANENYARMLALLLIREAPEPRISAARSGYVEGARGESRVPPLSSSRNGLVNGTGGYMPDNGAHMASVSQLRFGVLVGEVLGLHPVFAALLSPTGGMVGAGNKVIRSTDIPSQSLYPAITHHGVAHDAGGYLRVYHQVGPGYNYVPSSRSLLPDTEPLAGHINGIGFYRDLARFGHPNRTPSMELVSP